MLIRSLGALCLISSVSACVVVKDGGDDGAGGGSTTTTSGGGQGQGGTTTNGSGGAGGATTTTTTSTGGSGGGPMCEAPAGVSDFEIGTGATCFETLAPLDIVPLNQGPQGGYHVWLGIGCTDCGDTPVLTWGALDPDTMMTLANTYENTAVIDLSNQAWPQAAGIFTNMPGFTFDPDNNPPPAPGTHVILYAKLSNVDGDLLHEGQVEIVIGDTVVYDPCAEDPNAPGCGNDGAGGAFGGGMGGAGGAPTP